MREVICLHIGQAGIQLGNSIWELYTLEHEVDNNGVIPADKTSHLSSGFTSFFTEVTGSLYTPNAIHVDLEPTVIDEVRTGKYGSLFKGQNMINGKEDAANNFARGYNVVGYSVLRTVGERIQQMMDSFESFQGFMIFRSVGGGTGSGFASLLLQQLRDLHWKRCIMDFAIYPAPEVSTAVVEPYNGILATHTAIEDIDCSFIMDNEAMYKICKNKLEIERPTYSSLNRVVAKAISSVTASLRFDGPLNVDLSEFQTNLVPFPRIHFPSIAYAPIFPKKRARHESLHVWDITRSCFDPSHQMVKSSKSDYIACCLLYRGDVTPKDINAAINQIKERKLATFVDWSPTGFKVGINSKPPCGVSEDELESVSKAVCMVSNQKGIVEAFSTLSHKFDLMFMKRAFVHWYTTEGIEEKEFVYSREDIATLERDYEVL